MKRKATHRKPRPQPAPHPADDLSFMRLKKKGGGIDYWTVKASGNYGADCETGHVLAKEYIAYLAKHPTNGNAYLLGDIVHDMMGQAKSGEGWSGIHVTFLRDVNVYAMSMAAGAHGDLPAKASKEAAEPAREAA